MRFAKFVIQIQKILPKIQLTTCRMQLESDDLIRIGAQYFSNHICFDFFVICILTLQVSEVKKDASILFPLLCTFGTPMR